ncbi:MAG: hypothetical protein A2041_03995 [Bacteroidetes bacterium GWA2_31_9b]|nr:MAG: hypothetical protein A2041_03995 [Bacteroidetes bacterium GWA2_31_9b]
MKTKNLIHAGIDIPIVFWLTTIISGFILGNYNHLSRMVSELGALGTKTQTFFSIGLVLCAILSILFIIGLYKTCKKIGLNTIPVFFILSYTISIAGAGIFPLPLRLHLIMGMPSILLILSPITSLLFWKKESQIKYIKQMSIICLLIMSLGFLAFSPDILSNYAGLKQRFFHIGWSIWFIYLSYSFTELLKEKEKIKQDLR